LAFIGIFGSVVALKIGYKLFRWLRGNIAYIYDYIQGALSNLQQVRTNWRNATMTNQELVKKIEDANEIIDSAIKLIDSVKEKSKKVYV
jgi:hypothetical protein